MKKVLFKRQKNKTHQMLLTSGLFKQRVVKVKNRYQRKPKHRGTEMQ